jgi:hypothetical protein
MFPVKTKDLVNLIHALLVVTLMTRISNQINDMKLPLKKTKRWHKENSHGHSFHERRGRLGSSGHFPFSVRN